MTKILKAENKKAGTVASTDDVKKAIASKDWAVVDVRTKEEWVAAHIDGTFRIGRQHPEKQLANVVLDDDDKFVKKNIIVMCNSTSRASLEAETYRKMGFDAVKIYGIYTWIDECNPVVNSYSSKKNKNGTKNKFGSFKAEHCSK